MATVLALTRLFDGVVTLFAEEAAAQVPPVDPVPNVFGWREPVKHRRSGARLVWIPGDDGGSESRTDGDVGVIAGARDPGRNPRPLATLNELFTVYVEAVDITDPEDEKKQYQITRELFDAWYRAVYKVSHGTVFMVSAAWNNTKRERRFGAAIRVVAYVEAMIPDKPSAVAPVDCSALLDVELLDNTEQIEVQAS